MKEEVFILDDSHQSRNRLDHVKVDPEKAAAYKAEQAAKKRPPADKKTA